MRPFLDRVDILDRARRHTGTLQLLDRIAGTYASSEFPFEIEFANEDGGLIGTVDGESVDLQHYGKGVFGFVENPEARIHFDLAGDGAVGSFTLKQGGMEMTADRVE